MTNEEFLKAVNQTIIIEPNPKVIAGIIDGKYWLAISTPTLGTAIEITFEQYESIKTLSQFNP